MTKTTTRAMLCDAVAERTGLSKADIAAVSEGMFTLMGEALMAGENVKLTTFGSLQLRERAGRIGRNPRTGVEYTITPRQTVAFTPSAQLRAALDELPGNGPSAGKIRQRA